MRCRLPNGVTAIALCAIWALLLLAAGVQPVFSDSEVVKEILPDGVEHWYRQPSTDGKSHLTKKLEELASTLFTADRPAPFGQSVAFLVGVSKYRYLSPQLPSVENDVQQMRTFLLEKAGFDQVYVARNEIVDRDLIEKYIKGSKGFVSKMNENDRLLFYYSGHGGDKADSDGKTGYMMFSGAQKGEFWGPSVLAISNLDDWSREVGIKHMLFILDCCASGLAFTPKSSQDDSNQLLLLTLSRNGSRTVLTAGTADEETYELMSRSANGNGVFTRAFLNAFESLSLSREESAFITISDIYAVVEKEMAEFSRTYGKSITPGMWKLQEAEYRGTFVFLNPSSSSTGLTDQEAKVLGVSRKGTAPGSSGSGEGIIEVFSGFDGQIYVDGQDNGFILQDQTLQLLQQPVGKHQVELRGSQNQKIDVDVESGSIAHVSFGVRSPIDKTGNQQVGSLIIESLELLSGDVFIDNYKVGFLKENDKVEITHLLPGKHQYRISGPNHVAQGEIEVLPGHSTYISVRPQAPTGLRIVQ
jgi:hypothetical protein